MGERPDKETVEKIRFIIKKHPPLKGGYDIMLHSYGPERCMGTCNVEVPTRAHAENIFDAMTDASKEIEEELGIYFTFGLFAVNDYREDVRALKNDILEYLKEKTPRGVESHLLLQARDTVDASRPILSAICCCVKESGVECGVKKNLY